MKNILIGIVVVGVFGIVLAGAIFLNINSQKKVASTTESVEPTQELLGGDRDEYGCIGSAGYSWCESKQKCLRTWEEVCDSVSSTPSVDEKENITNAIKKALIAEHGSDAGKLNVTVSKIVDNYAQGGASQVGAGGGMWFAAKVEGNWELVWDGNGIINCSDLTDFPDFPVNMIPECFDETNNAMIKR